MNLIKYLSENILENESITELIPIKDSEKYISFLENTLIPFIVNKFGKTNEKALLKKSIDLFKIVLTIDKENRVDKFIHVFELLK